MEDIWRLCESTILFCKGLSMCWFWHPWVVLEPIPQGYQRGTVFSNKELVLKCYIHTIETACADIKESQCIPYTWLGVISKRYIIFSSLPLFPFFLISSLKKIQIKRYENTVMIISYTFYPDSNLLLLDLSCETTQK